MSERQRRRRLRRRQEAGQKTRGTARFAAGAGFTAGAVLGSAGTAHALPATFQVDRSDDTVASACTVAANDCTLRGALQDAQLNNNAPDQDMITFAGTVTGSITLGGTELPTIDEPLYVDGPGAGTLTVRADADGDPYTLPGPSRIVTVSGAGGSDVTFEGLTLSNGYYYGGGSGSGGAIFKANSSGVDLLVKDSVVSNNYAGFEGGGIGGGGYDNGTTTIENSIISGNSAGRNGGGIKMNAGGTVTIRNSTISDNDAGVSGGGLNAEGATTVIERSTISGNDAHNGGGANAGDAVTVNDSTISGNYGGGIYAYGLTMRRSTVAHNYFGGITAAGYTPIPDPILISTLVADNAAGPFHDLRLEGPSSVDVGFSLIEDPGTATISPTGANVIGSDPQLGALASNGGPTQTMKPASTSPAIDQGSGLVSEKDQRGAGFDRVFDVPTLSNAAGGNGADIGALELQANEYVAPPTPPTPVTPTTPTTTPSSGFDLDAALKKCKKKKSKKAQKKCKKKAKKEAQAGG